MKEILTALTNNPLISVIIASPIGVIVAIAIYRALLKIVLSEKNVHLLANAVDDMVDKAQKKSPEAGALTRQALIRVLESIVLKLKEDDGIN